MKKIYLPLVLVCCMMLCFFGCNNATIENDPNKTDVSSSESTQSVSEPIEDDGDTTLYKPSKMIERVKHEDSSQYLTYEYTYTYDSVGNLIKEVSSFGDVTEYIYDDGKLIKSVKKNEGMGEIADETTEYTYNSDGLLTQKTYGSVVVKYSYDENGNCAKEEYFMNGSDSASQVKQFTYDADHTLIKEEMTYMELVEVTEYTYDDNGKLVSTTTTETDELFGSAIGTSTYTYDENGNLQKIESSLTPIGDSYILGQESSMEYQDYKAYPVSK